MHLIHFILLLFWTFLLMFLLMLLIITIITTTVFHRIPLMDLLLSIEVRHPTDERIVKFGIRSLQQVIVWTLTRSFNNTLVINEQILWLLIARDFIWKSRGNITTFHLWNFIVFLMRTYFLDFTGVILQQESSLVH